MTASASTARAPWVLLFLAVALIAMNMRMTITGVGPLIEQIAADQGASPATLGILASVPLLAWGLFSPLAQTIGARLGMSRTISWSLVVLAAGTIWRSVPGSPMNLWLGTALIGFGLAIGNVLMPAVIKRDFGERIPLVMGVYTALLSGSAAVASGIVVPISEMESVSGEQLGWRIALLATGALLPPALLLWMWVTRGEGSGRPASTRRAASPVPRSAASGSAPTDSSTAPASAPVASLPEPPPIDARVGRRIWADPLAWIVSIYMGSQSASYYILSTWIAPYSASLDRSAVLAGIDTMIFQLLGVAGSMLLPFVIRGRAQPWGPTLVGSVSLVASIGYLAAPGLLPLWLTLGGLSAGASLTIALMLTATRSRTAQHAAALSGMAQSVGYLIAAAGPVVFGWLLGLSGGSGGTWIAPFALVWLVTATQVVFGLAVRKHRFVLEPRAGRA